jgi:hypothetical protein
MASSLDLLVFSARMSAVMKGLRDLDRHEMVLRGACLLRIEERIEENCWE